MCRLIGRGCGKVIIEIRRRNCNPDRRRRSSRPRLLWRRRPCVVLVDDYPSSS